MRSHPRVAVALAVILGAAAMPAVTADRIPPPIAQTAQEPADAREVPTVRGAVPDGPADTTGASPAIRSAVTVQVAPDPFVPLVPPGLPCGEWLDLALDVGWPVAQLPTLAYVIHRESRCHPGATGVPVCSAGRCARALGLTQLLGWSCPPTGCHDPASNLRRARELWERSGWRPWCLDGDPVTGSC